MKYFRHTSWLMHVQLFPDFLLYLFIFPPRWTRWNAGLLPNNNKHLDRDDVNTSSQSQESCAHGKSSNTERSSRTHRYQLPPSHTLDCLLPRAPWPSRLLHTPHNWYTRMTTTYVHRCALPNSPGTHLASSLASLASVPGHTALDLASYKYASPRAHNAPSSPIVCFSY
jgi:hypothetical protein